MAKHSSVRLDEHPQQHEYEVVEEEQTAPSLSPSPSPSLQAADDDDDEAINSAYAHQSKGNPLLAIAIYFLFVTSQTFVATSSIDVIIDLICYDEYRESTTLISGGPLNPDPRCRDSTVAARVATFSSYDIMITGILAILIVPKLSAYSDKLGRRPVIIWCSVAAALTEGIRMICLQYPEIFSYRWLLFASFIRGTGGSFTTMQTLLATYIADSHHDATKRGQYLGYLEGFFYLAMAVGPIFGSMFLRKYQSLTVMFGIALAMTILFAVLVYLFVPESRSKADQLRAQQDTTNNQSVLNIFEPLKKLSFSHIKSPTRRRNVYLLVFIMAAVADIGTAVGNLFALFAEFRFKWTSIETNYILTTLGTSRVILLGGIYPLVVKWLHSHWPMDHRNVDRIDLLMVRFAFVIATLSFLWLGNAQSGEQFFVAIAFDSFAGVLSPTMKNALIKYVDPQEYGTIMGNISFLTGVSSIIFNQVFMGIYKYSAAVRPGLAFEIAALMFLSLVVVTLFFRTNITDDVDNEEELWSDDSNNNYVDDPFDVDTSISGNTYGTLNSEAANPDHNVYNTHHR